MLGLKVIEPGLQTLIQDRGRRGFQQYGVPVSGVMDDFAYNVGNWLVGNSKQEAVLEAPFLGPKIEFIEATFIAVTGADFQPQINGQPVEMWSRIAVHEGDVLSFKGMRSGCRTYIAIAGGIDVPLIMGSRSSYLKGRLGSGQLKSGDVLPIGCKSSELCGSTRIEDSWVPQYSEEVVLRFVFGPQKHAFTEEAWSEFQSAAYVVSGDSDRMGYRLKGKPLQHKTSSDIISDGIVMGSIQVPGEGQPIVMMADRQTTGGYPKIGTILSCDLWKLAQAIPGQKIKFQAVSVEEAQEISAHWHLQCERLHETLSLECAMENPEIVAVIAAAVAFMSEAEGRQYKIRSLRPAPAMNSWARSGIQQLMESRGRCMGY